MKNGEACLTSLSGNPYLNEDGNFEVIPSILMVSSYVFSFSLLKLVHTFVCLGVWSELKMDMLSADYEWGYSVSRSLAVGWLWSRLV